MPPPGDYTLTPVEHDPWAEAQTHQAERPNPAAPIVNFGKLFAKTMADRAISAVTAPRDALYGTMQVTDPETGMPTQEAMQRGQGVANLAMTGGIPFAKQGAAGMAGGRLAETAPETITSAATRFRGETYTGALHPDAVRKIAERLGEDASTDKAFNAFYTKHYDEMNEGFVTSKGEFVGRHKASQIAERAAQYKEARRGAPNLDALEINMRPPPAAERIGFQSAGAQRGASAAAPQRAFTETPEEAVKRKAEMKAAFDKLMEGKQPAAAPAKAEPGGERVGFKSLGTGPTDLKSTASATPDKRRGKPPAYNMTPVDHDPFDGLKN